MTDETNNTPEYDSAQPIEFDIEVLAAAESLVDEQLARIEKAKIQEALQLLAMEDVLVYKDAETGIYTIEASIIPSEYKASTASTALGSVGAADFINRHSPESRIEGTVNITGNLIIRSAKNNTVSLNATLLLNELNSALSRANASSSLIEHKLHILPTGLAPQLKEALDGKVIAKEEAVEQKTASWREHLARTFPRITALVTPKKPEEEKPRFNGRHVDNATLRDALITTNVRASSAAR